MFWISLLVFSQAQIKHCWQECHLKEGVRFFVHMVPGCPCTGRLSSVPQLSWTLSEFLNYHSGANRCPPNGQVLPPDVRTQSKSSLYHWEVTLCKPGVDFLSCVFSLLMGSIELTVPSLVPALFLSL